MFNKKINNFSSETVLKGLFTNSDENGFLYLNLRNDKKVKQNIINECLAKLNNNYSTESNYYRNYLYLQQIDYQIGEVYAAIYSPDKLFYRAKLIKNLDYDKVVVNFIDFGNSDIIPKANLATLPENVSKIEPLVIICVIPNIRLIDKKRFTDIITEICRTEITVTIEGRCLISDDLGFWNNNEINDDILHLISFAYKNQPIQSYLLDNNIAVTEKKNYNLLKNGSVCSYSSHHCSVNMEKHTAQNSPSTDVVSNGVEYTKMVILIHVNSANEFFVHEFHKEVKNRLEYLQMVINKVVQRYKSKMDDNFFSKRNIYLTQFNEDKLWYRCKIADFEPKEGFLVEFIDFGNHEYKQCLSDLILLTPDMGEDALYLINEEPVSHRCQLSSSLISFFPSGANIKKYLIKKFVDSSKKVIITYHIKEDKDVTWLITNIMYHDNNLADLIKLHFITKESIKNKSHNSESIVSSHSLHDAADVKVADYLLNCCIDTSDSLSDIVNIIDSDRTYLVTHVEGINEIWIDVGDGQTREMVRNLLSTRQLQHPVSEVVIDCIYGVKINNEDLLLRCRAVDVCENFIKVHLLDKGTFTKVQIDDIFNISNEIISLPQQVLRFQLHNNLRLRIDEVTIIERLRSLIENQYVRIVRELPSSTTLVDLLIDNTSIVQALISANIVYLADINNWFKSHQSYRHKCIQVSPSQVRF